MNLRDQQQKALIVDPDDSAANMLAFLLARFQLTTEVCKDAPEAISTAKVFKPDIVLVEQKLPDRPGTALIQKLQEINRETGFILIAGNQSNDEGQQNLAVELGDIEILLKPINRVQVPTVLKRLKYNA